MEKKSDEYIEVSTSCENPEFPTRVRIIAFDLAQKWLKEIK